MKMLFLLLGLGWSTLVLSHEKNHKQADDRPVHHMTWKTVPPGIHVSFASKDIRYGRNMVPSVFPVKTEWETKAWKGEKVHTQFLIWTTKKLEKVGMKWGDLEDGRGNRIPAEMVQASFVGYVMADGPEAKSAGCKMIPHQDSSLVADIIDTVEFLDIEANITQPVWLSISVPQHMPVGTYTGMVHIIDKDSHQLGSLSYSIEVINHILPDPKDWKFHLDLWQNPDAIARVHHVEKWSEEHMDIMKPYLQMLADAGQKVITTTLIRDPWNSQTYDVYGSMIKWKKKKNGTWDYDYTVFDQYVSFMLSIGVDKFIECYSMIPWNLKFYYYDEALGKDTLIVARPGSPEYRAHWEPMLTDFAKHLKKKDGLIKLPLPWTNDLWKQCKRP